MKITLVKNSFGSFVPMYDSDFEKAKNIKINEPYEFEFKKPRNYAFHKKFFALLNLIYENQEQYNNIEHLRKDLIISSGFYDLRYNLEGVEIQEAKSISFASMDNLEFQDFYNKVLNTACEYLGTNKEAIEEYIEQYF